MELLILFLVGVFLHLWWRYWSTIGGRRPRNLPPGPPGWPLVGNLFQVILQRRTFNLIVRDLRAIYGPIFSMKMGQRTLVIITSSELMHEALVQNGAVFASRPMDSPIRLMFSSKCTISAAEYGPLWRSLRRNFVAEIMNPTRIKQCEWIRKWATENHLRRLEDESSRVGYVEVMSHCR